jgi:quinoprotein glucose dehydrogenase
MSVCQHSKLRLKVLILALLLLAGDSPAAGQGRPRGDEWSAYGGDNRAAKYSRLDQINQSNVKELRIAWRWESPDGAILKQQPDLRPGEFQVTPLLTKTLLFAGEGPQDPRAAPIFRAYDKATGKVVWEFKLDSPVLGAPMTYRVGAKQYIVVSCGFRKWPHELIAFSLP